VTSRAAPRRLMRSSPRSGSHPRANHPHSAGPQSAGTAGSERPGTGTLPRVLDLSTSLPPARGVSAWHGGAR
jgi:hypothetical protein